MEAIMSLDGFSMHPLSLELNQQLSGGRVDKVFQPNKHTIILSIRQPGNTFSLHISINPQNPVINIITKNIDNPAVPPIFCMVLRKQIEDGRIAEIKQHELDRIIMIAIDTRGIGGMITTKTLVVELMGKYSNIILLQDNFIIDSMKKVGITTSRIRQILPGLAYNLPPSQDKINVLTMPLSAFISRLLENKEIPLSKAIIHTGLGMGPVTGKELAWMAGLPASLPISEMSDSDIASLADAIQSLIEQLKQNIIQPTVITDQNKKLMAIAAFPLQHLQGNVQHAFTTMSESIDFSTIITGNYTIPDKEKLQKVVASELSKLKNKLQVISDELATAHHACTYKEKADILMTYQYQIEMTSTILEIDLPNIYADVPEENIVSIALNPRLSLIQNIQAYYNKYSKLKRAQESLKLQVVQCKEDIDYLASIDSSLDSSTTLIEINEIKNELIATGYLSEEKKRKMKDKPSIPLKFISPHKETIWVGKNNYQNDTLTFKVAQHNDIWLHIKDAPGSHVIIRAESQVVSNETMMFAAQLAAYFSKAKNSSNIPIDYTKRHYVKKPAKAKPGFVIYTNQKTLYVTPNHEEIERLLLLQMTK